MPVTAVADMYSVLPGVTSNASSVITNDTGSPLAVSAVNGSSANVGQSITLPSGASVTMQMNGTFSFTSAPNSTTEIFGYTASDGFTSDSTTVTINVGPGSPPPPPGNIHAPTISPIVNQTLDEGQTLTFSINVSDPDLPAQALTLQVNWGDGSLPETFNLPAGGTNVTLTHLYPDDNPTATPQDDYTISLNVDDGAGGNANQSVIATVRNVAPTAVLTTDYWHSPTDPVTVAFEDVIDAGTLDTFSYSFDWNGDGDFNDLDEGPGSYPSRSHIFEDGGDHLVNGRIEDDDGGTSFVQVVVGPLVIASVEWVAYNSPLDANPPTNPGGGRRIFTDMQSPTDTEFRFNVTVRVTLSQARANVRLYVRLYDVDDPSANPADAADPMWAVDDESRASDNRGFMVDDNKTGITDNTGKMELLFALSRYPGDNYRAVGAFMRVVFNGFAAKQNDGALARVVNGALEEPPNANWRVVQTPNILTVWRRLHVEVDSMGNVAGNTVTGNITAVADGAAGTSVVTTNQTLNDSIGRFQNGRLTDSAGNVFTVTANTAGPNFIVTVTNRPGPVVPAAGAFSLVDDDLLTDGQDVPMPDTSTLEAAMAQAYVKVLFDVGDSNNSVAFRLNVEDDQFPQIVAADWTSRTQNADLFWVAYVLGSFQGPQATDHDPNSESTNHGGTATPTGGSLIHIESNRDGAGANVAVEEQDTVVHEVGHAVAKSGLHPVTGDDALGIAIGDTSPDGIKVAHHNPSRYQPAYLAMIRSNNTKPRS